MREGERERGGGGSKVSHRQLCDETERSSCLLFSGEALPGLSHHYQ